MGEKQMQDGNSHTNKQAIKIGQNCFLIKSKIFDIKIGSQFNGNVVTGIEKKEDVWIVNTDSINYKI